MSILLWLLFSRNRGFDDHERTNGLREKTPGKATFKTADRFLPRVKKTVRAITEISTNMFHPLSNVLRVGTHIGGRGSSAIPKSSRELIIWGLNVCHLNSKENLGNFQIDLFGQCLVC